MVRKGTSLVVSLCVLVALCDPLDCSPPGSSIHGIPQARILEWVAIPFSRGSSLPGDRTQVSCIAGRFFTIRREALVKNLSSHAGDSGSIPGWGTNTTHAQTAGQPSLHCTCAHATPTEPAALQPLNTCPANSPRKSACRQLRHNATQND